jgi:hypothetical protein
MALPIAIAAAFPVPASLHAAPLPTLALTPVDIEDAAVGRATLSNSLAVLVEEQTFDCERTGMQRDIGRQGGG